MSLPKEESRSVARAMMLLNHLCNLAYDCRDSPDHGKKIPNKVSFPAGQCAVLLLSVRYNSSDKSLQERAIRETRTFLYDLLDPRRYKVPVYVRMHAHNILKHYPLSDVCDHPSKCYLGDKQEWDSILMHITL